MAEGKGGNRAVVLLTVASVSVPVAGLLSAPILSQSLGAAGRGQVGAAMAPNLVLVGLAILGLEQAMTFVVARRPDRFRASLVRSTAAVVVAGVGVAAVLLALRETLSDGDADLARLMTVAIALALPALPVALLRGAASGLQVWGLVAIEKSANAFLRLGALLVLLLVGELDIVSALVVSALTPVVAGAAYLPLLLRRRAELSREGGSSRGVSPGVTALGGVVSGDAVIGNGVIGEGAPVGAALGDGSPAAASPGAGATGVRPQGPGPLRDRSRRGRSGPPGSGLLHFASRAYVSSLAVMLLARASQLLVTPLSDVRQLGLLVVAITISDVPYIVSQTLRDFVFSSQSSGSDVERLLLISRTTTAITAIGSLALGASLPWWIGPVFGNEFSASVVTTWLLLTSATLAVPGLMAGALLDGSGRPRVRATAMVVSLVVNVGLLVLLVPLLGAVGAGLANLVAVVVSTCWMIGASSRVQGLPVARYVLPVRADAAVFVKMLTSRRSRRRASPVR